MAEEQETPKRGLQKREAMHDLMPQGFQLVMSQGQASREQQKILQDREYTLTQAYGRALRLDPKPEASLTMFDISPWALLDVRWHFEHRN